MSAGIPEARHFRDARLWWLWWLWWLCPPAQRVRVLLLASCEDDRIADWLGVVPYVISLSDELPTEDAAALAQHFWRGIGLGKEPGAALDEALAQCPPAVGECVVRHW